MMSMSKKRSSEHRPVKGGSATKEIKLSLFAAAVSATLRMVVPIFGLFAIGLTIDLLLLQEAFYAIIGALVGFLIAAFLIYLQIKKLKSKGQDSLINDKHQQSEGQPLKEKN
jgi:large-conductance mechanosensitive channel